MADTKQKKRKSRNKFLVIPLLGLLVLLGFLSWLLTTQAGLLFVIDKAAAFGGLNLQHQNLQGTLASTISADQIAYENNAVEVTLDRLETEITLFWLLDARLAFNETKLDRVTVALKDNQEPEKEPEDIELPVGFSFKSLTVRQITIADTKPIIEIDSLLADKIKLKQEIELDELQLTIANTRLSVDGSLGFSEASDIDLEASWEFAANENIPTFNGKSTIEGSFKTLSITTNLSKPQSALLETKIENIFSDLKWSSTLNSDVFDIGLVTPSIKTKLQQLKAELGGDLKIVNVRGISDIADPQYGSWNSQFEARFTRENWQVPSLQLKSKETNTEVQIQAQSKGESPYSPDTRFEMTAHWQQLQWPLVGNADYLSDTGKASVDGSLADYQIKTAGNFSFDDYQFTDIIAEGNGTTSTLNFKAVDITYLEGYWHGKTSLDWSDDFQWQAALRVKGANPAIQWQQLEGKLDAMITGQGKHGDDWLITGEIKNLSGTFRDYPVSGGSKYSVSGKQYAFEGLRLRSGSNSLSGSITLSDYLGNADTQINANWKLKATNMSQLLTEAAGSINSNGKIHGSLQSPTIDAVATVNNLKYQQYSFSKADLKAKANLQRDEKLVITLEAGESLLGGTTLEQFTLGVSGTTHTHELLVNTRFKEVESIRLRANGGYRNNQWDGKLAALDINSGKFGNWQLSKPARLMAANQKLKLDNSCLSQEKRQTLVCINIDSDAYTHYTVGSNISKLPIDLLRNLLPDRVIAINGVVDGNAQLVLDGQIIKSLNLALTSDGGDMTHTLVNNEPTSIHFNRLAIKAEKQNQSVKLSSDLDLQETGNTSAWLTLDKVNSISDINTGQSIHGEIKSQISDLSLLPLLVPEIQAIEGKVSSNFQISGTLASPKIIGKSTLVADRITLPLMGLELKSTKIFTRSTQSRKVIIEGSSQSGDGEINIKGEIPDYGAQTILLKLDISGKKFLAAKIPDIEMEISPQLTLILEGSTVTMDGEVFVDRAQITPLESYAGLTPSSDVVFIDKQEQEAPQETFKLLGKLRLRLSEQVYVQTAGFTGKVTGELVITESPNNVTVATGELIIKDGRYTAPIEGDNLPGLLLSIAQKELLIDESKLIFASSPIDNPRLDIRARRPTSNADIVVGVDIKGHANNPQILLFSEPAMDQADILAYLTLGYPLTEASKNDGQYLARIASSIGLVGGEKLAKNIAKEFGIDEVYIQSEDTSQQAQLVLGKYLSPKLYIRYAVGIGEAVDTLQIQYKLTDRWILRTETAETQKGTDLIYTIDK